MSNCQHCGKEVPPGVRLGLCPECLLAAGSETETGEGHEFGDVVGVGSRRFGDYEFGEQIGRGGMGVVYRATQVSLRRPVAVKMILDALLDSPTARRRFMIEAEAAAKLDHPNIVRIFDVGEHAEQPFLSMQLIEGESLRVKLGRGEMGVSVRDGEPKKGQLQARQRAVAELMALVARAVHHAHQKGVLHRDLKPGNILVDSDGQPHLTDFGLAKILETGPGEASTAPATVSGTAQGTPSYMSPEQALGRPVTPASDIYSLGAVLYELLTGQPPFKAHTPLETLKLVVEQEPRKPRTQQPGVALDLETISLKCLDKQPEKRYGSALALAEDLERWLRGEPIKARPAGWAVRSGRWVRRNRVVAGLIASLGLGLTSAALLLVNVAEKQKGLEQFRYVETKRFTRSIESLWSDSTKSHVEIESEYLAAIARLQQQEFVPEAQRLTFALNIGGDPFGRAESYAPVLRVIEERLQAHLQRPIRMDLRLYRNSNRAFMAVARGEVDFQRFSALNYLRADALSHDVEPIVQQNAIQQGVIFARADAGISNLSQVVGKRIAFAHTNSMMSFQAKVCLIQAGVTPANVASFENLNLSEPASSDSTNRNDDEQPADERFSHFEVIKRVLAGQYDVGEAPLRHFRNNMFKGRKTVLVELVTFTIPPNVIVARAGLERNVIEGCRQGFLKLNASRYTGLLGKLHGYSITGYEPVTDASFNELRTALVSQAILFDQERAPSSTVPPTVIPSNAPPSATSAVW